MMLLTPRPLLYPSMAASYGAKRVHGITSVNAVISGLPHFRTTYRIKDWYFTVPLIAW